jgi:hypothetical protein
MNRFLLMMILLTLPTVTHLLVVQSDMGTGIHNHDNYVLETFSFDSSYLENSQDIDDKSGYFYAIPYLVIVILSLIKVSFIQVHAYKKRHFLQAVFYQSNNVKVSPLKYVL